MQLSDRQQFPALDMCGRQTSEQRNATNAAQPCSPRKRTPTIIDQVTDRFCLSQLAGPVQMSTYGSPETKALSQGLPSILGPVLRSPPDGSPTHSVSAGDNQPL